MSDRICTHPQRKDRRQRALALVERRSEHYQNETGSVEKHGYMVDFGSGTREKLLKTAITEKENLLRKL